MAVTRCAYIGPSPSPLGVIADAGRAGICRGSFGSLPENEQVAYATIQILTCPLEEYGTLRKNLLGDDGAAECLGKH